MSTPNTQGYGFDDNNAVESTFMNPGINQNIKLKKVAFENSKEDGSGQDVLRFFFIDSENFNFIHTEFPIDVERTKAFAVEYNNDPEKEVKKQFAQQGNRVRHILSAYLKPEQLILAANSWEEYGKAVVTLAGDSFMDVLVRIKCILNNKDFLSFPKNSISPFIERMDQPQKMKLNPKYDRVEYKVVPVEGAASVTDAFSSGKNAGTKPAGTAF